ncbi:hypothetical protein DFH06DRAFT_1392419 [Mycena polygramma]|nr:hypothetical protein DFH06DRAFT_1392419 [Mycena polygramma]
MAIICTHCGHLNLPPSLGLRARNGVPSRLDFPRDLAVLEAKERELEAHLALVAYPVLALPTEIISMIFVHCLPAHGRVRPSPQKAPLLLAQICSLWRGIALSTGSLWASVDTRFERGYVQRHAYHDSEYGDVPNSGALPLMKAWLFRTKSSPVSLTLPSEHGKLSTNVLSLITSFAHQIYRLELSLAPADFEYLRGAAVNFPALRDLALRYSSPTVAAYSPVSIFGFPSSLRQMRILFNVDSPGSLGVYSFLTVLALNTTSVPVVLGVVSRCPSLLHLKVDLADASLASLQNIPPRILGLHSLVLAASYRHRPDTLLNLLTLPKLLMFVPL